MTRTTRIAGGGTLLSVALVLVVGCSKSDTPSGGAPTAARNGADAKGADVPANPATPATAKTTSREPAATIKAEDVPKEFKDTQTAETSKYKDEFLAIEGVVEEVPAIGSKNRLSVGSPQEPGKGIVICDMSPEAGVSVLGLGKGQKVKVVGKLTVAGGGLLFLNDCTYTEQGPNPTTRVTAKDLGAEFAKDDGQAATKKYASPQPFHDKELFVEGVVKDVGPPKGPWFSTFSLAVELDAGMQEPLVCAISMLGQDAARQLKPGDRVVMKGNYFTYSADGKNYPSLTNAWVVKKL
jgi:hypothetical protein